MPPKLPLVSIMIPTYNQSAYLPRAIESALNQTYVNTEIIISDDSSSDNTRQVVEHFLLSRSDPRIRYRRNPSNLGILRNYHTTLSTAKGEFVINLDGDDFFVNDKFIEDALPLFQLQIGVVLVFGDYVEYLEETRESTPITNSSIPQIMSDQDFFSLFAKDRVVWNHNTILYRRSNAVALGFYWDPDCPRNDWESFLRLILGNKVAYLPGIQSAWVHHAANETRRANMSKYLANYELIDSVCSYASGFLEPNFIKSWRDDMIRLKSKSSIISYLNNRDYSGLVVFLCNLSSLYSLSLVLSTCTPNILIRFVLSLSPFLNRRVKHIYRTLSSALS